MSGQPDTLVELSCAQLEQVAAALGAAVDNGPDDRQQEPQIVALLGDDLRPPAVKFSGLGARFVQHF